MYRSFFALLFLLALFACQNTPPPSDETLPEKPVSEVRYQPSDVQKMRWLAGAWKSSANNQTFLFHGGNSLEIMLSSKTGGADNFYLTWNDGRYYYGANRQWVVTWIGEKDVRLDPVKPNLLPMTWTRLNDDRWHLVRHTPDKDEAVVMERANEMQP
ncbi:MAG: hypothetical protein KIS77_08975 [Saprospiraceae bacterium]|nr:hypothetical protein [Saprospiraceae bacterium]